MLKLICSVASATAAILLATALAGDETSSGGGVDGGGDVPVREPTPGTVQSPQASGVPGLLVVSHDANGGVIDSEFTDNNGLFVVDVEEDGTIDVVGTSVFGAPVDPGNPVVVILN